jgi:hypothetical protein
MQREGDVREVAKIGAGQTRQGELDEMGSCGGIRAVDSRWQAVFGVLETCLSLMPSVRRSRFGELAFRCVDYLKASLGIMKVVFAPLVS